MKRFVLCTLILSLLMSLCSVTVNASNSSNLPILTEDLIEQNTGTEEIEQNETISDINLIQSVLESTYEGPKVKYLIKFKAQTQQKSVTSTFSQQVTDDSLEPLDIINAVSLELTEDQLATFIDQDLVETVEIDQSIKLSSVAQENISDEISTSPYQTVPWGMYSTGTYAVNSTNPVGERINVAVFDTGIASHQELSIKGGISFVADIEDYWDDHGHGTQIAGPIAALDNDKGIVGSTSNVDLYSVKTIDSRGNGYISSIIQGLQWAIENNIKIVNMSFVVSEYSQLLHEAIQAARNNGILIIAAAGNSGSGENTIQYPSLYPEVLSVGSIDKSHTRSQFSSTGPELDIVAPGSLILTTNKSGQYSLTSGTSIAASHVTGAAALLWSQHSTYTANDIVNLIKTTATPLGSSSEYGHGLINVAKALNISDSVIVPLTDQPTTDAFIWAPTDGEINIASYDPTGDGQIIIAGEPAQVSIKLEGNQNGENVHQKIDITVFHINTPEVVIASHEILQPPLHEKIEYSWFTSAATVPGMYVIKFAYPALLSGEYDDYFLIYVQEPGNAAPTNLVALPSSNSIKLSWNPPLDAISYSLLLNGVFVGNTTESTYIFDNLEPLSEYRLAVAATYPDGKQSIHIEVISLTTMEELVLYTPVNINQESSKRKFVFKPAVDGIYQFTTSQNTSVVDTQLKLYSNSSMSNVIARNDDFRGSVYSQIRHSLVGGKEYYIEVSTFGEDGLSTNILADVVSSEIPYLQLNSPVDINEILNNSTVYVFIPPASGNFNIATSFYQGKMNNRENDTQISLFYDKELTLPLQNGYSDDTETSVFSDLSISLNGGLPYYVKVSGFDNSPVFARLLATQRIIEPSPITNKTPKVIQKQAGEYEVFKYVPNISGRYRMFTSPTSYSQTLNLDTEIFVYADANSNTRLEYNDDVKGQKPYGSLYSKLELDLTANEDYYIVVKNRVTSTNWESYFMIEDSFTSTHEEAQVVQWGDLVENDANNNALTISSLYDVDFFKVVLEEEEQVSFTLENATGYIEDEDGNKFVYISNSVDTVFDFLPGTYYFRIMHDVNGRTGLMHTALFNEYQYSLGVYINELNYGQNVQARASVQSDSPCVKKYEDAFDATPLQNGCVEFNYKNKINSDELVVDIFERRSKVKIASFSVVDDHSTGSTSIIRWSGHLSQKDLLQYNFNANVYTINWGSDLKKDIYYAKNGNYLISIYPKGKQGKYQVVYHASVSNDPLNEHNWIPMAPTEMEVEIKGIKIKEEITNKNKNKCVECINYYMRYIWEMKGYEDGHPANGYEKWLNDMYGLYGLAKFWQAADDIFMPSLPPDSKPIDYVQDIASNLGLIPVLGSPMDAANSIIYFIRGDNVNALLSAASMVPVLEYVAKAKKSVYALKKYTPLYAKSPCNCFAEGTVVTTDDGSKNIEDIQIGDMVLSKNEITGDIGYKPVEFIFEKDTNELFVISVGGVEVSTTDNHPFWVEGKGWVIAEDLLIGDKLLTSQSDLIPIENIIIKQQVAKVYNITVADYHTYFTTELEIFTHNLDCYNYQVSNLPPQLSKTYPKSTKKSTILGEELIAAKYLKPSPDPVNGITDWRPHHIVPHGATKPSAAVTLQNILKDPKINIDLNSAANGVWLPVKTGYKTVDILDSNTQIIWKQSTHNGGHSDNYYEYVLDRISPHQNRPNAADLIRHELNEIRKALLSGDIIIGKV